MCVCACVCKTNCWPSNDDTGNEDDNNDCDAVVRYFVVVEDDNDIGCVSTSVCVSASLRLFSGVPNTQPPPPSLCFC